MSKTILVVDDDDNLRPVILEGLKDHGFDAHPAEDGKAALKWLSENDADLVITDVIMPNMDGMEFCQTLRKQCPTLSVIAASAGDIEAMIPPEFCLDLASAAGAWRTLRKPFKMSALIAMVRQTFEKEESQSQS